MTGDLLLAIGWVSLLLAGLSACVILRKLGLSASHVRDCLHIGAGCWVLGWPWWEGLLAPGLIVGIVATGTAAVPLLARRSPIVARFRDSVSGGDEGWSGLAGYTLSAFVLTLLGLAYDRTAAASALAALALGDGIGGAVGLRFGRVFFRMPWGKRKSLEGTLTVMVMAALGIFIASAWVGLPLPAWTMVSAAILTGAVEAASPRSSDNVLIPATVFLFLVAVG